MRSRRCRRGPRARGPTLWRWAPTARTRGRGTRSLLAISGALFSAALRRARGTLGTASLRLAAGRCASLVRCPGGGTAPLADAADGAGTPQATRRPSGPGCWSSRVRHGSPRRRGLARRGLGLGRAGKVGLVGPSVPVAWPKAWLRIVGVGGVAAGVATGARARVGLGLVASTWPPEWDLSRPRRRGTGSPGRRFPRSCRSRCRCAHARWTAPGRAGSPSGPVRPLAEAPSISSCEVAGGFAEKERLTLQLPELDRALGECRVEHEQGDEPGDEQRDADRREGAAARRRDAGRDDSQRCRCRTAPRGTRGGPERPGGGGGLAHRTAPFLCARLLVVARLDGAWLGVARRWTAVVAVVPVSRIRSTARSWRRRPGGSRRPRRRRLLGTAGEQPEVCGVLRQLDRQARRRARGRPCRDRPFGDAVLERVVSRGPRCGRPPRARRWRPGPRGAHAAELVVDLDPQGLEGPLGRVAALALRGHRDDRRSSSTRRPEVVNGSRHPVPDHRRAICGRTAPRRSPGGSGSARRAA